MLSAVLALALGGAPVTQDEAVDFHRRGLCQMAEAGVGITRPDGHGWIASMLPGPHRIYAVGGRVDVQGAPMGVADLVPGRPIRIRVEPIDATVIWCPRFKPAGRADCGPVPPAFLYNASRVGD